MAKKQAAKRSRNQKNPQTQKTNKIKSKNESTQTGADDASSEEEEPLVAQNDAVESSDGEEDQVVEKEVQKKSNSKRGEDKTPNSINRKTEKDDAKSNKGKKRSKNEDDDVAVESDAEEKSEHAALYTFPMNRVSRIIRSDNPDIRISQEAIFLINRASEKFLQVFCREAYACLFLEGKSYSAYNHLSSVVAKRKRFQFLSDFVPEKVKAEVALAQTPEAEAEAET